MGLSDVALQLVFKIDWTIIVIQVIEMLWYCCEKLWTLFCNHYLG